MQMKRRSQNHTKPSFILYAVTCFVVLSSVAFANGPLKDRDRETKIPGLEALFIRDISN
ncbi:MAG: hypothetical protein PHN98_00505 [Smithellaceae bacterium]|nr:hypothetical protein [Smithellaceae bacterium]